jgi:alanine dehydrogenase
MAILLRESDVEKLLTMKMTLELIERVHREYSTGQASDVPRERTRLPKAALHMLQGAVPSAGVFGYKAYTSSREAVRFLVYMFSAERGTLEAIVEADYMGMMRTGAAAAWRPSGSRARTRKWRASSARAGRRAARSRRSPTCARSSA